MRILSQYYTRSKILINYICIIINTIPFMERISYISPQANNNSYFPDHRSSKPLNKRMLSNSSSKKNKL